MVRVPDAAAQVRSAPVKALRGFFAGIGQMLITADRIRAEDSQTEQTAHEQAAPERAVPEQAAPEPAVPEHAVPGHPVPEQARRGQIGREQYGQTSRSRPDSDKSDEADRYTPLTAPRGPAPVRRGRDAPRAGRHRATNSPGPAASAQTPSRRFRSLDSTGNVRLLTSAEAADADASLEAATRDPGPPGAGSPNAVPPDAFSRGTVSDDAAPDRVVPITPIAPIYDDHPIAPFAPVAEPYGEPPSVAAPSVAAPPPVAAAPPAWAFSAADLPVPGYDQLTLASLRSRLRYLDVAQLRTLADYEKATANRSDFVGMFERRIAKLRSAGGRAT